MNIIRSALVALLLAANIADAAWPPEWDAERECLNQKLEDAYRHESKAEASCSGVSEKAEREGLDEWLLSLQLMSPDEEASRWHIARAAILLDSDVPLSKYMIESTDLLGQTTRAGQIEPDPTNRMTALPFLLLAKDLGAPWAETRLERCKKDTAGFYIIDFCYKPNEFAQGPALLEALRADLNTGPPPNSVQLRAELDRTLSTANTDGYEHEPQSRLEELARSNDTYVAGKALWELGMRTADSLDSRKLIMRAAILLEPHHLSLSSSPILSYYYRFLLGEEKRIEALPLLLLGDELGEGWPEERLETYAPEERASGEAALAPLKAQLQP